MTPSVQIDKGFQCIFAVMLLIAQTGCDDEGRGDTGASERATNTPRANSGDEPVPIRFEAEDAELDGTVVSRSIGGYSGDGYVDGFDEEEDTITFTIEVEPGQYALGIGFATPHGTKGFELSVNEVSGDGQFEDVGEAFSVHDAGIYRFDEGENLVVIGYGWGYFAIDYIELTARAPEPPLRPPKTLTDSDASDEARSLFSFLVDNFGKKVLSGQQSLADIEYVESVTGRTPAVGVFDVIDYSPSRIEHGADPTGETESWIEWADNGGGIVGLSWHWNAPTDLIDNEETDQQWWRGFYTDATTFDIKQVLDNPDGERYELLLRDLDAIAAELQKMEDADLPVLWRPLHEASGGWFWWGARGPEPFIELWRLMWDRYVNHHGLHHLVWVYTIGDEAWYPGDEFVDIVSWDIYSDPSASMSGQWEEAKARHDGVKLIALSEAATAPDPQHIRELSIWWSWFNVWNGEVVRSIDQEYLRYVYEDEDILTLDELPAWWLYPRE